MIAKHTSSLQSAPVVLHENLHTTFNGIVHPISNEQAAVHQYLGIKYASVPARFRHSKLFTSFPPVVDATQNGSVIQLLYIGCNIYLSRWSSPICPQSRSQSYEMELFGLPDDVLPQQILKQSEFECLNLNITCPAGVVPGSGLPVMLFIHG